MINLLPTFQKEELKRQESLMVLINIGISILIFLLSLFLLFLAVKFFIAGELNSQKVLVESKMKSIDSEIEKEILKENKTLIQIFNFEKQKRKFLPALEEISNLLPKEIELKSILISKTKERSLEVSLIGFAKERKNLIFLIDKLKDKFSKVEFPPQIWLKEKDIDFSINFKIK
jgi:DNA transposition AAA+ family ATPase